MTLTPKNEIGRKTNLFVHLAFSIIRLVIRSIEIQLLTVKLLVDNEDVYSQIETEIQQSIENIMHDELAEFED